MGLNIRIIIKEHFEETDRSATAYMTFSSAWQVGYHIRPSSSKPSYIIRIITLTS